MRNRPEALSNRPDVLADILGLLRLKSSVYCLSEIGIPEWRLQFTPLPCAAFHFVHAGSCWLQWEAETLRLSEGDLVMLPHGTLHTIGSHPSAPLVNTVQLNENTFCQVKRFGERPSVRFVCGTFDFESPSSIFSLLPPMIHFSSQQTHALGLSTSLDSLAQEAIAQRLGAQTLITRLADVLFVQIIRAWIDRTENHTVGWLGALHDPHIAHVLGCIHAAPEHDWTVALLAREAAMSRSAFATRFKTLVGQAPLAYLTRWRMQKATRLLAENHLSLLEIALQTGYQSEAAFSKAFKREFGISPRASVKK